LRMFDYKLLIWIDCSAWPESIMEETIYIHVIVVKGN